MVNVQPGLGFHNVNGFSIHQQAMQTLPARKVTMLAGAASVRAMRASMEPKCEAALSLRARY